MGNAKSKSPTKAKDKDKAKATRGGPHDGDFDDDRESSAGGASTPAVSSAAHRSKESAYTTNSVNTLQRASAPRGGNPNASAASPERDNREFRLSRGGSQLFSSMQESSFFESAMSSAEAPLPEDEDEDEDEDADAKRDQDDDDDLAKVKIPKLHVIAGSPGPRAKPNFTPRQHQLYLSSGTGTGTDPTTAAGYSLND